MSGWTRHAAVCLTGAWLCGCAAHATPAAATQVVAAPTPPRPPADTRAPCVDLDSDGRAALATLERLDMVIGCEEASPGTMRLQIGGGWSRAPAEYHLNHLFNGYSTHVSAEHAAVIELWNAGQKVGEYTIDGLVFGPELTAPR